MEIGPCGPIWGNFRYRENLSENFLKKILRIFQKWMRVSLEHHVRSLGPEKSRLTCCTTGESGFFRGGLEIEHVGAQNFSAEKFWGISRKISFGNFPVEGLQIGFAYLQGNFR